MRAAEQPQHGAVDDALVVPLQPIGRTRAQAVEHLYATHYRDVYRYVLGLTRSPEDADDITSDTFERALRSWRSVPDRPVPWLLLTARRLATDRWRRARRLGRILLTNPFSRADPPGAPDDFEAWLGTLARVLTARQREVLILRYERDLSDADIGAVMSLSESGVRSLAARALAVLRSHPELLS